MTETPRRFIRVPDSIWDPADAKAKSQNRTISEVTRLLLFAYGHDKAGPAGPKV